MIIKSKGTRAAGCIGRILEYISRDSATVKDQNGNPYIIRHNLVGNSLAEFARAFAENEANRQVIRKNQLLAFHEYMAWHPKEREQITPDMIKDMVEAYLDMRAENGMCVSYIHGDAPHPHAHLLISSVELVSGKSLRLSKERFAEIQQAMQEYQRQNYPELDSSLIDFDIESKQLITDDERAMNKRGVLSRKQELIAIMETTIADATSRGDFYSKLSEQGIDTYERAGEVAGIDDARHYRWGTLGVTDEQFQELDVREQRLVALNETTNNQALENLVEGKTEVQELEFDEVEKQLEIGKADEQIL